MGAPQGTSVSNTPTGASPGLDAGDNGVVPVGDNVIGSDATIESAKLEPLKPEATTTEDASKGVASVLDGLAASQPAKTAGDLVNQATGELRKFVDSGLAPDVRLDSQILPTRHMRPLLGRNRGYPLPPPASLYQKLP